MGESQYSASLQSASTRSYATADTSFITQNIIPLYLKNVPFQALGEAIKQIKNIYILHLLLFQENVDNTSFYAILIPFLELVTYTLAEAHSQLSKKNLQKFILNHQAFVADIYLLYNFFTLLFMQLLVSCVLGGLYNFILPMLTENKEIKNYYVYYLIMVLSAPITSSMAIYVENIMDISRQQLNCYAVRIMDPILTMIIFNIFLLIKPETFTNITLYMILAVIQSIIYLASYIKQLMMLFARRRNKLPIRLNFRNFKPFRGVLFLRMLYQQLEYILSCGAEYVNALLVVIYTQADYSSRLYYPNIVMCTFLFIRSLTKTGKSLQFASRRFLEAYIESNIMVNQVSRIYEMITKGLLIHITLNLIIVGVVYWISIPIANMLFSKDKFTSDEYDVVLNVNNQVTISALCIFAHILTPFNQAMIYIYDNKFTKIMKYSQLVIDWAIIIAFIILQRVDSKVYMYINYYTVYEVTNGFANALFFIILLLKYRKYNKQVLLNSPLLLHEQEENNEQIKQESNYIQPQEQQHKQSEVIYQINKLSTKTEIPNLDELFAIPSINQDSDIFNSSSKSKDKSKSPLRKSKINHEDVDLDDSFQLRNSILIKNDND